MDGPYQVDLENVEDDGRKWHTGDWLNHSELIGDFEGGLIEKEAGLLEQQSSWKWQVV